MKALFIPGVCRAVTKAGAPCTNRATLSGACPSHRNRDIGKGSASRAAVPGAARRSLLTLELWREDDLGEWHRTRKVLTLPTFTGSLEALVSAFDRAGDRLGARS